MIQIVKKRFLVITIISLISISALLETQKSSAYWPTMDWEEHNPGKEWMNAGLLDNMYEYIEDWNDDHFASHIDSAVIIRNGYLIGEWYYLLWDEGDKHALWSVTKSFTCTLIGIAIQEGFITSVDEYVLDYFSDLNISNVDSRKEAMTIEHLLMMSTGLAYPGDDIIWSSWMNAPNQVKHILDLPMATDPGAIFNYDTGGSHLLSAIITNATGMSTADFATEYLFNYIGIEDYYWQVDKQGIYFGGHGLYLTPPDMARLGYLYLNKGNWDGRQILPENWTETTTNTIWTLNYQWGYSQQWWTHPYLNAYSARGRYGQSVIVLPEQDTIVVFTASISDADHEPYMILIDDYILLAILDHRPYIYTMIFVPISVGLASIAGVITWIIIRKNRKLVVV